MNGETGYRALLSSPGVARAVGASTLSRSGDAMFVVVLVLFVLEEFGSPTLAGLAAFCALAPGLVLSPLAGALLDRSGPSRPMLLDYAASAFVVGLVAVLSTAGLLGPAALLALAAAYSATSPLGAAGVRTLLPAIVPKRLWDRANAADTGSITIADAAGPALAGALFAGLGGEGALLATSAVFTGAALAFLRPVGRAIPRPRPSGSILREAWEGLRCVVANPILRGIALSYSLYQVGYGAFFVALPVLVLERFSGDGLVIGALWGALGAMGVASSVACGGFGTAGRERLIMSGGMLATGAVLLALPLAGGLAAVFACVCAVGLVGGPVDVALLSLRQRKTDPARFGRVLAISMGLNVAGFPLGSAASGPLLEASVALGLVFAATTCALAGLLAYDIAVE